MIPQLFVESIDLGDGRNITIETGRLAKQADGSVVVRIGNTAVSYTHLDVYKRQKLPKAKTRFHISTKEIKHHEETLYIQGNDTLIQPAKQFS